MYFLDLNCVYPLSNAECVYSQKYTTNINYNYTFVLRATTTKQSHQMGQRGRVHRKIIQVKICSLLTICFPRMFALVT